MDRVPALATRTVDLVPGWNVIGYTGADELDISALLEAETGFVDTAFRFDSGAQTWLVHNLFQPHSLDFLNTFNTVDRLTALFVYNGGRLLHL